MSPSEPGKKWSWPKFSPQMYISIIVGQLFIFAALILALVGPKMWTSWERSLLGLARRDADTNRPIENIPGQKPGDTTASLPNVNDRNIDDFLHWDDGGTIFRTAPPVEMGGYVAHKDRLQELLISINYYNPLRAELNTSGEYINNAARWTVTPSPLHFQPGLNTVAFRAVYNDGRVLERTYTFTLVSIPVDDTRSDLTVRWLEQPIAVPSANLLGNKIDAWREVLNGCAGDYGCGGPEEAKSYKLGTVVGGPFAGKDVYYFWSGWCEQGMGCYQRWYRILFDARDKKIALIPQHSDGLADREAALFDSVLPNVRIPALEMPERFTFNNLTFVQKDMYYGIGDGSSERWFTDLELYKVGTHSTWGNVYTTPTLPPDGDRSGRYSTNGFYLKTPDNHIVSYVFDIPFVMNGKIPSITWNDGSKNTADYFSGDTSGCGGFNAFAVRTGLELQPTTRLVVGGRTSTGDSIYLLKDQADQELIDEYASWYPYNPDGPATKPSFEEFVAMTPVFYWKDPFNRWIRFKRADLQPMAECGKPVIYLYPEKEMPVHVLVGLKGEMTVSEPEHGTKGWDVLAMTDGYVVNQADGKTYPNLFWEGTGVGYKTPKQGFVVAQKEVADWLEKTLADIGFTERESAEFREFWLPRLPQSPYLFITFVPQSDFDRDAPLFISPKPDSVSRVFMEYHPLYASETVEPLPLPKIERHGFTVVEWGGALRK